MEKFYNPVKIYQGVDCLQELSTVIEKINSHKVLLLTYNQEIINHVVIKDMLSHLKDVEVIHHVMEVSNPDLSDLHELYTKTNENQIDLVIAVGGGSVLDVAKSLCCLYGYDEQTQEEIRQRIKNKEYENPKCPWIGMPTTSGTGSEVTCWATIWDRQKDSKLSLENQDNYAYAVFVDPRLTTSMPLQLIVSSALDAVAHATEAYWSKNTNTISRIYALKAIYTIFPHLERIVAGDHSLENFDALSQGSMLAGLAFSNTKTTACHSISYPLTLHYQIPHGVAVSLLLAPIMQANYELIDEVEDLLTAYGVERVDQVAKKIQRLLSSVNIETSLSQWGVQKEELNDLTKHCFTAGRMENNPKDLTQDEVLSILNKIY
ncbi:MAG: phosphonoacetaldehyde reductase [Coprobacillus sp.]